MLNNFIFSCSDIVDEGMIGIWRNLHIILTCPDLRVGQHLNICGLQSMELYVIVT